MRVVGLVTEYNPFHNGHLYHLNKSKELTGATHSVAVMSGHFLQRGEPALLDKWSRAEMAVSCGVDLVVELPVVYSCATADQFARGSVSLLDRMGIVNALSFGSESGEVELFREIGYLLANPPKEMELKLREHLNKGFSFARSQQLALQECCDSSEMRLFFQQPNNILGMLYVKHLFLCGSSIQPHTIQRIGAGYHSVELQQISSATGIRQHIESGGSLQALKETMPESSFRVLENYRNENKKFVMTDDFAQGLMMLLKRMTVDEFKQVTDVTEGLENRLWECAHQVHHWKDFSHCVKSKRYPYTRVQRMLMHILLNIKKPDTTFWYQQGHPEYLRILAFNQLGRELINLCKKESSVPIITKTAHYQPATQRASDQLELDFRGTDLHELATGSSKATKGRSDYLKSPTYLP